jgi:hypothetical protein
MAKLLQVLCFIAFLTCFASAQTANKTDFDEQKIVRLKAGDFGSLPIAVAAYLNEKKCTIPQTMLSKQPHNVLEGEFYERGRKDWAVLCSRDGVSAILVFKAGSADNVTELGKTADKAFIGAAGKKGDVGFLRQIKIVKMTPADNNDSSLATQMGIEDAFFEKTANIFYFFGQRWVRLKDAY